MSARNSSKDGISRRRISSQCRWWILNNSTRSITASSNSSSKLGGSGFGIGLLGWQQQTHDRFDLGVEFPLPCLKALTVEKADSRMLDRRCDGQVLSVERLDQPILHSRHADFPSTEFVFELRPDFRRLEQ